jgi:alpha-N-arabinofuranosidase
LISLSAHGPEETNTLSVPTRIKPVESELRGITPSFEYALPPYSIQVLELSLKR